MPVKGKEQTGAKEHDSAAVKKEQTFVWMDDETELLLIQGHAGIQGNKSGRKCRLGVGMYKYHDILAQLKAQMVSLQ